jgi:hypothetical protein
MCVRQHHTTPAEETNINCNIHADELRILEKFRNTVLSLIAGKASASKRMNFFVQDTTKKLMWQIGNFPSM